MIYNLTKNLANEYFLVTGSGKFIRNMTVCLEENEGIVKIHEKGENYKIAWGLTNVAKPTSELLSLKFISLIRLL